MSETDDTDVLLLIPPDFFLVRSSESEESHLESSRTVVHKPKSCTAQVIGKLVNQVHSLESRLETLEISTTITDSSFGTIRRRKNWESDSLDSHSVDKKSFTFPRRRRRKLGKKKHDSSLVSLDSLICKSTVPPLKLKEFELTSLSSRPADESPTMDGDLSSIVSTPSKKNDKLLLHEIDEFLSKVEKYEYPEANPSEVSLSPENVIKATGDYLTQKLDSRNSCDDVKLPSGRIVPSSVLEKYIYLVQNRSDDSSYKDVAAAPSCSQKSQTESQNPESVETLKVSETSKCVLEVKSPSVRKLNFVEKPSVSDVQPTSTPKKLQQSSRYIDSFNPSSNKIYDRATKVLEQYKSHNFSSNLQNSRTRESNYCDTECHSRNTENFNHDSENSKRNTENLNRDTESSKRNTEKYHNTNYKPQNSSSDSNYLLKGEFKLPQMRPFVHDNKELKKKMMDTVDTELLSLSELWGDKGEEGDRDKGNSNKLEEERLKREHCEALIQELQKKVLQQEERLAVAVRVDRAKDAALQRLRAAGQRLAHRLERAEARHGAALEAVLTQLDGFRAQLEEAHKKTNHFETELYKALDLAHDYQEKCKQLSEQAQQTKETAAKEVAATQEALASKDREIQALKDNCESVMRLNKQYTECTRNMEEVLAKERTDHEQTKSMLKGLQSKLQSLDEEMALVRQERELLQDTGAAERARCSMLERQLCDEHRENGELTKRCQSLECEVQALQSQLDSQRTELRTHYQTQLENAVLTKLREFESQLEAARNCLESEARDRETALADTLHQTIRDIQEQHKLEVCVLEEKHREEIKLHRLQLAQAGEKASLLESKLESYRRRRSQIASQLHSVMESQWRQALLILTGGGGSGSGGGLERGGARDRDTPGLGPHCVSSPAVECGAIVPPLRGSALDRDGAWAHLPRDRDGDSCPDGPSLSDRDLKQYVKMLLTKAPNLDGSGDAPSGYKLEGHRSGFDGQGSGYDGRQERELEEPTSDRADRKPATSREHKRSLGAKPPWKA